MITFGPNAPAWLSLGWVIALVVLILDIVFIATTGLDSTRIGLLIGGLALAILL